MALAVTLTTVAHLLTDCHARTATNTSIKAIAIAPPVPTVILVSPLSYQTITASSTVAASLSVATANGGGSGGVQASTNSYSGPTAAPPLAPLLLTPAQALCLPYYIVEDITSLALCLSDQQGAVTDMSDNAVGRTVVPGDCVEFTNELGQAVDVPGAALSLAEAYWGCLSGAGFEWRAFAASGPASPRAPIAAPTEAPTLITATAPSSP
jgi:hypothetical protein